MSKIFLFGSFSFCWAWGPCLHFPVFPVFPPPHYKGAGKKEKGKEAGLKDFLGFLPLYICNIYRILGILTQNGKISCSFR